MATSAERQRAYRQRARLDDRRVNTWIDAPAALALARLARHEGTSQRAVLERLIVAADAANLDSLDPDSPEWSEYFGGQNVSVTR